MTGMMSTTLEPMRILVFEYITAGCLPGDPPPELIREGDAMLKALLADCCELPDVRLLSIRDTRLADTAPTHPSLEWRFTTTDRPPLEGLMTALNEVDAVWPIAPETDGELERLCERIKAFGVPLLTTGAAGVRIAASKYRTLHTLAQADIPVVPSRLMAATDALPEDPPLVAKPDDGVGCEGIRLLRTAADRHAFRSHTPAGLWVIQPLLDGTALSLSVLFAHGQARLLSVNRQQIEIQADTFVLTGCVVNAVPDHAGTFAELACDIASAMPDLWGYAGVDLIQTPDGVFVLEINPRLTSSYPGLKRALGLNPARLVIDLWQTGTLPGPIARPLRPVETRWSMPA